MSHCPHMSRLYMSHHVTNPIHESSGSDTDTVKVDTDGDNGTEDETMEVQSAVTA